MAYSDFELLRKAFRRVDTTGLTPDDCEGPGGIIENGDAIIDSALAERYAVPFAATPAQTPPVIRFISTMLALTDVLDRMPETPPWLLRRIERASNWLDRLAKGEGAIVGVDGVIVESRSDRTQVASTTSGYTPIFGVQPSLDEEVDPDRADAEARARD
jgi:phage gp36-like protein